MTATALRAGKAPRRRPRAVKRQMTEQEKVVQRLRNLTDEELVARWHDMLEIVLRELKGLDQQRQTMDAVTYGVFNGNKRLLEHPGRRFFNGVLDWYGAAMAPDTVARPMPIPTPPRFALCLTRCALDPRRIA